MEDPPSKALAGVRRALGFTKGATRDVPPPRDPSQAHPSTQGEGGLGSMIKTVKPQRGLGGGAKGERSAEQGATNPCGWTSPHHIPPLTWLLHPPPWCPHTQLCGSWSGGEWGRGVRRAGMGELGAWVTRGMACWACCATSASRGPKGSPQSHPPPFSLWPPTCTTLGSHTKPSKHTPTTYLG